jgi:hypothetical protein
MAREKTQRIEAEEPVPAGAEFVPEKPRRPKSDIYTLLLVIAFAAFFTGSLVAGRQAWEHYDVQFWLFTKHPPKTEEAVVPDSAPVSNPQ